MVALPVVAVAVGGAWPPLWDPPVARTNDVASAPADAVCSAICLTANGDEDGRKSVWPHGGRPETGTQVDDDILNPQPRGSRARACSTHWNGNVRQRRSLQQSPSTASGLNEVLHWNGSFGWALLPFEMTMRRAGSGNLR